MEPSLAAPLLVKELGAVFFFFLCCLRVGRVYLCCVLAGCVCVAC